MQISSVINQMLVLLILLIIGVIARRTGVTDAEANKKLTRIVLVLAQSAMILSSVMNVESGLTGTELLQLIGISCVIYAIMFVISIAVTTLFRIKPPDRGAIRFMMIFGNVGFMGFPVIASLFGDTAVFYTSLFNIPFNLLVYSLGILLISEGSEKVKISIKHLINAPLIATFAAVLIFIFKVPIPEPIAEATDILGDMVVPSAMLIIGASLGDMKIKDIFGDWRIYAVAPIKLIGVPVVIWAILRLFVTNPLILGIATVIAAMPVATNSTMLCIQYKGNEQLASRGVFITTVLSVITIPLIVYLLLI